MNIVPIKISGKLLYENRHLFTDDVHYNSLVISIAINMKVNLINVEYYNEYYNTLDDDYKMKIYTSNDYYNFILNTTGLFRICLLKIDSYGVAERLENDIKIYGWQDLVKKYKNLLSDVVFDVLTIV